MMKQLKLKGVRDTSIISYHELLEHPDRLNETYRLILKMIKKMGPLTDRELTQHLLLNDPNRIRPRRNELADSAHFHPPLIAEDGKRVCKVSGKTAYAWKLTSEGASLCV
jgi:hypothetical protein